MKNYSVLKREAFHRAEQLLEGELDEPEVSYAALELRKCLEAVVYEKLKAYEARIPPRVARRWQPPQAFRALEQLEPGASRTSTWRVAVQKEPDVPAEEGFVPMGTDRRPDLRWLSKTYNKLGSLLHTRAPFSADRTSPQSLDDGRRYLEVVAEELKPFLAPGWTSTLAALVSFECSECSMEVTVNAEGAGRSGEAYCLNPECECRFIVSQEDGEFSFQLDAQFADCVECGKRLVIPTQRMKLGAWFDCPDCDTGYILSGWQFARRR